MIRFCTLACLTSLALAPLTRAEPTRDLLRSVPPESTLCFVAQDWKTHAPKILASPFVAKLKRSDLGKSILNPESPTWLRTSNPNPRIAFSTSSSNGDSAPMSVVGVP